jgi:hypothetical protein
MILRINKDDFYKRHQSVELCNGDALCFLGGTDVFFMDVLPNAALVGTIPKFRIAIECSKRPCSNSLVSPVLIPLAPPLTHTLQDELALPGNLRNLNFSLPSLTATLAFYLIPSHSSSSDDRRSLDHMLHTAVI